MKEIENRRSIRKYKDQVVEKDKIQKMLESAMLAPSGSNTQPWDFIVITSKETKEKLAKANHNQEWMTKAPVMIACIADISSRIKDTRGICLNEQSPEFELKQIIRDTAIAIEHMVLQAEHLGLGTCWTAWFTQDEIRPILNIPNDKFVVCILTVGYADENPKQRPRKSLDKIVHYEKW
ncbi:nitroreductase family protein [Clostridium taeniosporum]|uniref:Nitroreductase n=1 Tax=Clostridium taeniosporum TaxID=394958 RepID=A0A1D7XP28_9CLOT|nr:nitroreductase family protein [Clostridium taeniosporum]AOR25064.1 nitroreductase [Clostridium taeniosporum]